MTRYARLALGAVLALLALPGSALAADIDVTTTDDAVGSDSECSLREAIFAANDDDDGPGNDCAPGSGTDTVLLPANASPYALEIAGVDENSNFTGDLDTNSNLIISGAGASATVIDGSGLDRVFDVIGSNTVEFRDLTVSGGETRSGEDQPPGTTMPPGGGLPSPGSDGPDGQDGAGIFNTATLTLTRVTVRDNVAGDGGDAGDGGGGGTGAFGGGTGGISLGGNGGTGGDGGGIANAGTLTIVDSTVSENTAGAGGAAGDGGIGGNGGPNIAGAGGAAGNSQAGLGGTGGSGGGISSSGGTVTIMRSTIAQNSAGPRGPSGNGGDGGVGGGGTTDGGTGGHSIGGGGFFGGFGGGISQSTTALTLTDSTVRDNSAGDGTPGGNGGNAGSGGTPGTGSAGAGGDSSGGAGGNAGGNAGIDAFGGSVNLTRTTVSGNQAGDGGNGGAGGSGGGSPGLPGDSFGGAGGTAGLVGGVGTFNSAGTLTNVTIASNGAGNGGAGGAGGTGPTTSDGGDGAFGGSRAGLNAGSGSTFSINHATIALNETGTGGAAGGAGTGATAAPGASAPAGIVGGLASDGTTPLRNTLIASNEGLNCGGAGATDNGNNLSFPGPPGDTSCPASLHDDPLLGALLDNGGFTRTMRLAVGSPALNEVPASGAQCAPTDQRNATRPKGPGCDIGAFELSLPSAVTDAAGPVTSTGAKLNGTVNPGQLPATYRFEYGKTAAYGSETPETSAGAGAVNATVAVTLGGLTPRTTYHYRLLATGPDGTTTGADRTFTTPATPTPTGATPPPGTVLAPFGGVSILTKSARADRRGRVSVKLRCPARAVVRCKGRLSLTTKRKRKTVRLGSARFSIAAGKTKTVRIKLSRSKRRLLARSKRLRGSLSAAATDNRGGKAKTTKGRLRVRAPKRSAS